MPVGQIRSKLLHISQPPAPFDPIARGRAGPNLLALILAGKLSDHPPLNRQSDAYAREGIDLDVSTLTDWVGACTATLAPLVTPIRAHVMAGERLWAARPPIPTPTHDKQYIVTACGRICVHREKINLSTTRSARGCHPCLENKPLPISPDRTG